MKQKTIRKLIEESGVKGFDFDNDDVCITWNVTPGAGKMLAQRITDYTDDGYDEQFFAVPYADIYAVEDLYETIVADFVALYYADLRNGTIDRWNLFSDIASLRDEGLLEMLSFFGKTYDEFLGSVFKWFGTYMEVISTVLDCVANCCECQECEDQEDEPLDADSRLVIKVLDRLGTRSLDIGGDESGMGYYWNFAVAHGELWYSLVDYCCGEEGYYVGDTQYGHVKLSDEDAMLAIKDMVTAQLEMTDWQYYDLYDCMELLDIAEPDDAAM